MTQTEITSFCICKKWLNDDNYGKVVLFPCNHIFHRKCIKYIKNNCPWCLSKIETIKSDHQIKDKEIINNLSSLKVSNNDKFKMLYVIDYLCPLFQINDYKIQQNLLSKMFQKLNIKITAINYSLLERKNVIYICNHSSILDCLILFRFIDTCIFADDNVNNKLLKYICPNKMFLMKKTNNVESIKKFIKNNSLLIFPEGRYVYGNYLDKFRSGAFNLGIRIQPITITYDNNLVNIRFFPIQYPPFNEKKIENIRNEISTKSNLILSGILNKKYNKMTYI